MALVKSPSSLSVAVTPLKALNLSPKFIVILLAPDITGAEFVSPQIVCFIISGDVWYILCDTSTLIILLVSSIALSRFKSKVNSVPGFINLPSDMPPKSIT